MIDAPPKFRRWCDAPEDFRRRFGFPTHTDCGVGAESPFMLVVESFAKYGAGVPPGEPFTLTDAQLAEWHR